MLKRLAPTMGWAAALIIAALAASPCLAAQPPRMDSTPLTKLASARFPKLTHAEVALLEYVDLGNLNRGEWAVAGPSQNPLDPSNDPKDAASWTQDRDIRATLIEWLAVDHAAIARIHPSGIRVLGARVTISLCGECLHLLKYADASTWKWFREYRDRLIKMKTGQRD